MIGCADFPVVCDIEASWAGIYRLRVQRINAQEATGNDTIADVLLTLRIVCQPTAGVGGLELQSMTGPLVQDHLQAVVTGTRKCANVNTATNVGIHRAVCG